MARRNFLDRAREFVSGAARQVSETIGGLFGRESQHTEIQDEPISISDPIEAGSQTIEVDTSIIDIIDSEEDVENFDDLTPEGFEIEEDSPDEEFESEFNFEIAPFGAFDQTDLRRIVSTFEEAVNYADEIPLPANVITIVRDPSSGFFRVLVEYGEV